MTTLSELDPHPGPAARGDAPPAACPACGAAWRTRGKVHVPLAASNDPMLGGGLALPLPALDYQRCASCGTLVAADARRDADRLAAIYRALPEGYWQQLATDPGFADVVTAAVAQRVSAGDWCDVGCGDGGFLERLPAGWRGAGIEPGQRAVDDARRRGLHVQLGTASTLALEGAADVCSLVDVAEHLLDPEAELRAVYRMLRPGGVVVVLTGDAGTVFARLAGAQWYYLHCVGHVTVFSCEGLVSLLARCGFEDIEARAIEHPGAKGLVHWCRRYAGNTLRRLLGRPAATFPYHGDHQLVIASRPA